jgi:repressor LexA
MAEYIEREELDNGEKIVFNAIVEFFNKNKFPPTIRELCKLTGYKSTCTVQNKLKSLELKGYIETNKREKRTLRIKESTADVVPVVRCKDCKHFQPAFVLTNDGELRPYTEEEKQSGFGLVSAEKGINCGSRCERFGCWEQNSIPVWFSENDFCSYGERRCEE